jgi:hypothetical protein
MSCYDVYVYIHFVYILDWKMQKGLNKREKKCEKKKKTFLYSNERFFPSLLSYSSTLASICRMLIYTYIFFVILYWDMYKSFVIITHAHSKKIFQFTLVFCIFALILLKIYWILRHFWFISIKGQYFKPQFF